MLNFPNLPFKIAPSKQLQTPSIHTPFLAQLLGQFFEKNWQILVFGQINWPATLGSVFGDPTELASQINITPVDILIRILKN